MSRMTEYCEWTIDAAPIMLGKLFRASAVIELPPTEDDDHGHRFVFTDLGDFESRDRAQEVATAWVKRWIDNNYGHR